MIVTQTEPHAPQLIPILIPIIYTLYSSQTLVNLAGCNVYRGFFLSDNDESSSLDSNISLPDLTKLQPYEFEPLTSSSDSSSSHSDYITYCPVDDSSRKRLGNTKWCQCGN